MSAASEAKERMNAEAAITTEQAEEYFMPVSFRLQFFVAFHFVLRKENSPYAMRISIIPFFASFAAFILLLSMHRATLYKYGIINASSCRCAA